MSNSNTIDSAPHGRKQMKKYILVVSKTTLKIDYEAWLVVEAEDKDAACLIVHNRAIDSGETAESFRIKKAWSLED